MNYKKFGYEGKPRTCLWCGANLRDHKTLDSAKEQQLRAEGAEPWDALRQAMVPTGHLGPYQDDSFCTATCGYWFGRRMAELGHRLQST